MRLSTTAVSVALVLGAAVCFGLFVLYGAWIDGKRQKMRDEGGRPTATADREVEDSDDDD